MNILRRCRAWFRRRRQAKVLPFRRDRQMSDRWQYDQRRSESRIEFHGVSWRWPVRDER